jgi:hypothetical protein
MYGYNSITLKGIYPSAQGATVAQNGTGSNMNQGSPKTAATEKAAENPVSFANAVGQRGNIVVAGLVLVGLVFGIMMLSEKFGGEGNSSIKATFFNVMIIGLAAAVGTPIWKYFATRFPIPGASSWILAG